MVAEVPSHLDVVLDRDDIKDDLESIIGSMRSLRRESLANNKITSEDETTYRHLVHRLATSIKALTDDEEEKTLDELVNAVTRNGITFYDVEQEKVREQNKSYFQKLRHTSFNILGELYMGLEDEYHILQAIKELQNSELNKKPYVTTEELINKTNTYHQNWFMKNIVGPLTGIKIELMPLNDTTIEIKTNDIKTRENLIEELNGLGIKKIRYKIKSDDLDEIKNLKNTINKPKTIESSEDKNELVLEKNNLKKEKNITIDEIKTSKEFFENLNNPEKKEKTLKQYLNPNIYLKKLGHNIFSGSTIKEIYWNEFGNNLGIKFLGNEWEVWDFDGKQLSKKLNFSITDSKAEFDGDWITSIYNNNSAFSVLFSGLVKSWNARKDYLAVNDKDKLQIFKANNSESFTRLVETDLSHSLEEIAWHPDSSHLVTSSCCDNKLVLWDFDGQNITKKLDLSYDSLYLAKALSWNSGGNLLSVGVNETLSVYHFMGQKLNKLVSKQIYADGNSIKKLAWNPNDNYLAVVQGPVISFLKISLDKEPGITTSFNSIEQLKENKSYYITRIQEVTKSLQKIDCFYTTNNDTFYNMTLYLEKKNANFNMSKWSEDMGVILSEDKKEAKNIKLILNQINKQFNPEYVHIKQYVNQEKTADLELIK